MRKNPSFLREKFSVIGFRFLDGDETMAFHFHGNDTTLTNTDTR